MFGTIHLITVNTVFDLPTFIIVSITFLILVVGLIINWYKNHKKKKLLKELFDVYYEQSPNEIKRSLTLKASPYTQDVNITLLMKTEVNLDFINVTLLKGNGLVPTMESLNDWQYNHTQHDEAKYKQLPDGGWTCNLINKQHKNAGQHFRIGIKCLAQKYYDGSLKIYLSTDDGGKKYRELPLKVEIE